MLLRLLLLLLAALPGPVGVKAQPCCCGPQPLAPGNQAVQGPPLPRVEDLACQLLCKRVRLCCCHALLHAVWQRLEVCVCGGACCISRLVRASRGVVVVVISQAAEKVVLCCFRVGCRQASHACRHCWCCRCGSVFCTGLVPVLIQLLQCVRLCGAQGLLLLLLLLLFVLFVLLLTRICHVCVLKVLLLLLLCCIT